MRSRSFLGKYPEGAALPPLQGMPPSSFSLGGGTGKEEGEEAEDERKEEGSTASTTRGSGSEEEEKREAKSKEENEKEDPSTFVLPFLDAFNHRSGAAGATRLRYDKASASFVLSSSVALAPGRVVHSHTHTHSHNTTRGVESLTTEVRDQKKKCFW